LPPDALLLTCQAPFQQADCGDLLPVWTGRRFRLCRQGNGAWAIPTGFDNPNGLEGPAEQPFFWIGKGTTTIDVLANRPGTVAVQGEFGWGPSLPETNRRRLRIRTSAGYQNEFA